MRFLWYACRLHLQPQRPGSVIDGNHVCVCVCEQFECYTQRIRDRSVLPTTRSPTVGNASSDPAEEQRKTFELTQYDGSRNLSEATKVIGTRRGGVDCCFIGTGQRREHGTATCAVFKSPRTNLERGRILAVATAPSRRVERNAPSTPVTKFPRQPFCIDSYQRIKIN